VLPEPALTLLLGCFLASASLPLIFNWNNSAAASDSHIFHIPQINTFLAEPFNVFSYPATSATTPGYHILLAWLMSVLGYPDVGDGTVPLRLINLAVGCVPVAAAWLIARRLSGCPWHAAALVAPVAGSSYVLSSASFVTTDNAALAFYTLALFLMVLHGRSAAVLSISLLGAAACRQVYLPIAGALALSVFDDCWTGRYAECLNLRRFLKVAVICLPAVILTGLWAVSWGGFVPPEFRQQNGASFNIAVPVQALSLTGLFAFTFALPASSLVKVLSDKICIYIAAASALIALPLWLACPTAYDAATGLWGSVIWTAAAHSPQIGSHSLVVLLLTLSGVAVIAVLLTHAFMRSYFPAETLLLLFYLIGYSAQPLAWQRYVEPQILLTLGVFTARLPRIPRVFDTIPICLALISAVLTILHTSGALS
jgi:hypothetical protein